MAPSCGDVRRPASARRGARWHRFLPEQARSEPAQSGLQHLACLLARPYQNLQIQLQRHLRQPLGLERFRPSGFRYFWSAARDCCNGCSPTSTKFSMPTAPYAPIPVRFARCVNAPDRIDRWFPRLRCAVPNCSLSWFLRTLPVERKSVGRGRSPAVGQSTHHSHRSASPVDDRH